MGTALKNLHQSNKKQSYLLLKEKIQLPKLNQAQGRQPPLP
jgi:hypothetical protein